jgi:hypothetical protein
VSPTFVIGDIHGEYEKLVTLLREAELVGKDRSWTGGDATVWFLGDFYDRGPDGTAVVEGVRRLQREAPTAGGSVGALLGNHELLLLAAHFLGPHRSTGLGGNFREDWELARGVRRDLSSLTADRIHWLTHLPAMTRAGDKLLAHADALFYARYGGSVREVNQRFAALLQNPDPRTWDQALEDFSQRNAFAAPGDGGAPRAREFLRQFGGRRLVHGHTPISALTGQPPEVITKPLIYASGLCVNVDGGMCLGGRGFVYRHR